MHAEAAKLDVASSVRDALLALNASTLHRLLGWRPDSHSRFRHNRGNRLPHDVVIVDETSMVSLSLMARLVEAVRPEARLVLVGDPGQLTSIEAGAVLGDIVRAGGDGVVVLEHVYRYGAGIDELAAAIRARRRRRGRSPRCSAGHDDVTLDPGRRRRPGGPRGAGAGPRRRGRRRPGGDRRGARGRRARRRSRRSAPSACCAPTAAARYGVSVWTARIEGWLAGELERGRWYPGRPLLVTENDYGLRLYNGDTGVVVATGDGRTSAAFERQGERRALPARAARARSTPSTR